VENMVASSVVMWKLGAALSASAVASGAFGAHALAKRLGDKGSSTWSMASSYLMVNGVALLAISQHPRFGLGLSGGKGAPRYAGMLIGVGAITFSGSIFLLLLDRSRFRFLGPVTPLGGVSMIAGYLALLF